MTAPPTNTSRRLVLALLLILVSGCSGISVRRVNAPDLLDAWHDSWVETTDLSPRTIQTLRQVELDAVYRRQPAEAHQRLQSLAAEDPQPDYLFALAEMSFSLGRLAEKYEQPDAIALYYLCAGYAYHFLFDNPQMPGAAAPSHTEIQQTAFVPVRDLRGWEYACFDPRFRLACDLYNAGLSKCIRAAQRIGSLNPCSRLHLPTPNGTTFMLSVVHQGFAWKPTDFGSLLFCADFKVSGLDNQYRGYGLGVPLIGTRNTGEPLAQNAKVSRDITFPVTAFFRFEGTVADLTARHAGRLELLNPLAIQAVDVQGRAIPLEIDLTTPMAYFLSHTKLGDASLTGFLNADKIAPETGIYMVEPYQPGKIPVLLVHGLLSSPITWAPLFNDLQADPALRERYQFWFYLYPTVNPYLVTAADLRQRLTALRTELDPEHRDPAMDQMVLVGHSMGGLVSKLLTTDSGNDYWNLVSSEPFERLQVSPQARADLQKVFFFERLPFVKRVIFLGTPHRGSRLSPSAPAKVLAKFIRLPIALATLTKELEAARPKALGTVTGDELPISLDLLDPASPALQVLVSRPKAANLQYHSIIGVLPIKVSFLKGILPGGRSKEGTDGVVPYSSAHVDDANTEVVVPADHFEVHHHPRSVLEVRRILRVHLLGESQSSPQREAEESRNDVSLSSPAPLRVPPR